MIIQGMGVSPGIASGMAISAEDYQTRSVEFFEDNKCLLLAKDLSFDVVAEAILGGRLVAVIAEQGGLCSHGATLAREFGIPCVTGVGQIQDLFGSQRIVVDGAKGTVEVMGVAH